MSKLVNNFPIFLSRSYWKYTFLNKKTLEAIFSCLGGMWLIISIINFFFPSINIYLVQNWKIFFSITCLYVFWVRQPKNLTVERLNSRDLDIEIRIGDIFNFLGAKVISTNTTFDTDIQNNIISINSLQGQFFAKHYDNVTHLDLDIERSLVGRDGKELQEKTIGKKKQYKVGAISKLRAKDETFYLLAIADLNKDGVAQTTFENIKISLAELWEYIGNSGNMEQIVIPLVGSGRCRLPQTRNIFAKEIIKSFIAACSYRKLCEKLTIVISPYDYKQHDIDLYELGEYLRYQCKYTEFYLSEDNSDSSRLRGCVQ